MGIFRKAAKGIEDKIRKSKEASILRRAESDQDNQGNAEAAAIAADQLTTAKKTRSVYRNVPIETLRARARAEREQAEEDRLLKRQQLEQVRLEQYLLQQKQLVLAKWMRLLKTLKDRFENPDNQNKRHPGLEWAEVQEKLEANPDKLWSLNEMERTGGEPDVVGYENGEYIFFDCSTESPTGRRNLDYDQSLKLAKAMKIKILTREEYENKLQKLGEFDKNTRSWIKTPVDERDAGVALDGFRLSRIVLVYDDEDYVRNDFRGFRGSLRV